MRAVPDAAEYHDAMSDETNEKPEDKKREPKHVYGTATGTAVGRGAAKPDGG